MTAAERIVAIKARLAKATPGPWRIPDEVGTPWSIDAGDEPIALTSQLVGDFVVERQPKRRANADLIANAPADLAWLLKRVERLETALKMALIPPCEPGDPLQIDWVNQQAIEHNTRIDAALDGDGE